MSDEPFFLKEEKEKLGLQRANGQTEATLEPLLLGKRVKEIRLSQNQMALQCKHSYLTSNIPSHSD